jgi:glycosyltransferase involved in cell wall biosynthesis
MKVLMIAAAAGRQGMAAPEDASRRLARALVESSGGVVTEVIELSATELRLHGGSPVARIGDGAFVVGGGHADPLRLISHRSSWANRSLREWIVALAPDVVHFHGLSGVGADLVPLIRRALPTAVLVLTVHDLLLACANDGTLVRSSGQLCEARSSLECADCIGVQPVDIMLRDDFFRRLLRQFNVLVAPTYFAAGRLRTWLGEGAVDVVRDYPLPETRKEPRSLAPDEGRGRIGFFGELTLEGGLHVLLDAVAELRVLGGHSLEVQVFGTPDDSGYWDEEIVPRLDELVGDRIRASYAGEYRAEDVPAVMAMVDWVAVPTLGWEASPEVVMTALAAGRPVLVGNVGGMSEMVDLTGAGRAVPVGSIGQWMDAVSWAVDPANAPSWDALRAAARVPWDAQEVVDAHVALYRGG